MTEFYQREIILYSLEYGNTYGAHLGFTSAEKPIDMASSCAFE